MTNESSRRVEDLAALIREVDGAHRLGAAALAEALTARGVRVVPAGYKVFRDTRIDPPGYPD